MHRHRAIIGILLATLSACTEERIVRWNPPLGSLPGATTTGTITSENRFGFKNPAAAPEGGIRQEDESGEIHLAARSGRHLMAHIYTTLLNDERDLFADQVLSDATRQEFIARGRDPREAFDMLKPDQDDIFELFDLMPNGEYTPGVVWQKLGKIGDNNVVRLGVGGRATSELRYSHFDMVMEHGSWRLRWFTKQ